MVRDRGEVRTMELTTEIQRPEPATKVSEIRAALERWDTNINEFNEAGGRRPSLDERRNALISILPMEVRREVLVTLHVTYAGPHATQQEQDLPYLQLR